MHMCVAKAGITMAHLLVKVGSAQTVSGPSARSRKLCSFGGSSVAVLKALVPTNEGGNSGRRFLLEIPAVCKALRCCSLLKSLMRRGEFKDDAVGSACRISERVSSARRPASRSIACGRYAGACWAACWGCADSHSRFEYQVQRRNVCAPTRPARAPSWPPKVQKKRTGQWPPSSPPPPQSAETGVAPPSAAEHQHHSPLAARNTARCSLLAARLARALRCSACGVRRAVCGCGRSVLGASS
jgi:hypothetical protein